jgi:predicted Zn-dependent protease
MRRAQELTAQAVDSAMRNGHKESAAIWEANAAVRAAGMGNVAEAHRMADAALKLLPTGQAVKIETALALAMAGDTVRTTSLAQDLNRRFPLDTQVQSLWLPTIEGQLALDGGDAAAALNRLHAVAAMDMASIQFLVNVSCLYPVYVRGEAYLAAGNGSAAASEFERILDHSGITWNCWTGALAKLGLARAYALEADAAGRLKVKQSSAVADHAADPAALAKARSAYQDFFTLWKDADPDIPVLREARAEFAKLQ